MARRAATNASEEKESRRCEGHGCEDLSLRLGMADLVRQEELIVDFEVLELTISSKRRNRRSVVTSWHMLIVLYLRQ